MKILFLSVGSSAPPRFELRTPDPRELVGSRVAIFSDSLDEPVALLKELTDGVPRLIITVGEAFSHSALGPFLWHLVVPAALLPHSRDLARWYLDILSFGQASVAGVFSAQPSQGGTASVEQVLSSEILRVREKLGRSETAPWRSPEDFDEKSLHLEKLAATLNHQLEEQKKAHFEFREAVNHSIFGIFRANVESVVIYANPALLRITGYESIDAINELGLPSIYHPRSEFDRLLEQFAKGAVNAFETQYIHADGHYIDVLLNLYAVRGDDGHTLFLEGSMTDITGRKQAEEELRRHQHELEALVEARTVELRASNAELEAFAYSVSHDLRAPLRAIGGFTRLLMEEYVGDLDDEAQRLGRVVQQNARKMGQLIDDLLAFSRMGRVEMHVGDVDMNRLVGTIYTEATSAEQRAGVSFSVADLPAAKGDPSMMHHVWTNLISNALKFSSHRSDPSISIGFREDDDAFVYFVKDNGAGFDMRYVGKVFDVFQRLHSEKEFEGTGVGLALVQRIVKRHGGDVWAHGESDVGATFYYSLPKRPSDSGAVF